MLKSERVFLCDIEELTFLIRFDLTLTKSDSKYKIQIKNIRPNKHLSTVNTNSNLIISNSNNNIIITY
jgi:hypothetical protein